MKLSMFGIHRSGVFLALVALTACTGALHAANQLALTPSTISLACNSTSGPGPSATVVVKPVTPLVGTATIAVTLNTSPTGVVVAPGTTTLSTANQAAGLTYTFTAAASCTSFTTGSQTFAFKAAGVNDAAVTVNTTLNPASVLVTSPTAVTITCEKTAGGAYIPGPAQTVSVTSPAAGGTAFTVDNSSKPSWATLTNIGGGTASTSAVNFTIAAVAGCGGFNYGSTNAGTIHLLNPPAVDKVVNVNLQILHTSPLTGAPNPASLTYTKGSGTPGYADVAVTSSPAAFFSVDTTSLPIWLTVDSPTGTTPKSLRFSSTSVADSLAPGAYSASVRLKVANYSDLAVTVNLLVSNPAAKLTTAEGTTRAYTWTVGQPLPTPYVTLVSSDTPVPFTITTGGPLAPIIDPKLKSGLAYNFGTPIPVTFDPLVFAAAPAGSVLTGTVSITSGNPSTTLVVTFNYTVQAPGATLSSVTPAGLPTSPAGTTLTVVLIGTGFVPSTDPTQKTKVGIVTGGSLVTNTNFAANVVNASNIILTITVPTVADPALPFAAGGTVNLGICNPQGAATCSIPTGTASITIGSNPIIQVVTSASSFIQVNPGTAPTVAPYDMISLFGTNFCSACSSAQVLYGTPDLTTLRYPSSLTPDTTGTLRNLKVTFQTHPGGTAITTTNAPLLFATNGQINLMVPQAVAAAIGGLVDIVVSFGYGTGATLVSSASFPVNVAANNPGVFTVGSDGQGDGAILDTHYAVISSTNPVGIRSTASDSDTISIYMTGLGVPDSTADNASPSGSSNWPADCITPASYIVSLTSLTSVAIPNVDGTVIQSSLLGGHTGLVPCLGQVNANKPTVTIGNVAATVTYAGWVPDSIAGLYQVNARLPGSSGGTFVPFTGSSMTTITAPVQLPVVVTANGGKTSQTGVTVWVAPRLKMVAPTALTGKVGAAWASSGNSVVASEGTSSYQYAVTGGLLPSGLSLDASSGAISGTPALYTLGTYPITVTATDSAATPVTGTVSFTLTIGGGLMMSASPAGPTFTQAAANMTLTTVQAAGGVGTVTYALTAPATPPTGMTVDPATGDLKITASTPTGTYAVTVQATDSTTGTPLTGSISFSVVVQ